MANQEEWLERIEDLEPFQVAWLLSIYEGLLAAVCGSHHLLIEAAVQNMGASGEELRSLIAAWAVEHSGMVNTAQADILNVVDALQ